MKVTKDYLEEYRLASRFIAAHRDGSTCPLCQCSASQSDHVFGRGSVYDLLKEHWALRMSLCHRCHYQKHHGRGFDKVKQVRILMARNVHFMQSDDRTNVHRVIRPDIFDDALEQEPGALDFIGVWLVKNG